MTRTLAVWFNDVLVGHLIEEKNIWAFRYCKEWVASDTGFDLFPSIPRKN